MAGVILENISTKKLICICLGLIALQLACFLASGYSVPEPTHYMVVGSTLCVDKTTDYEKLFSRDNCQQMVQNFDDPDIETLKILAAIVQLVSLSVCQRSNRANSTQRSWVPVLNTKKKVKANEIVFMFKYPLPRDGTELQMSRWFMYHTAVLTFDIIYDRDNYLKNHSMVELQVTTAARNDINNTAWKKLDYLSGSVLRPLKCAEPVAGKGQDAQGYRYDCDVVDFFETDVHYKQYLVNIRLPPNSDTGYNMDIGKLEHINLVWFAQTGGFTLYSLVIKTVCFALILPLTIWYWKRISDLSRKPVFLEKLLFGLALAALLLNLPVDWFVLVIRLPFLQLWSDIRQGVFLTFLLSFWLIFTGEHMVDEVKRGEWSSYWKQLALVILGSILMFVFDMCERGVRLVNPFYSIWATSQGTNLALAFIWTSIVAGLLYFIILMAFIIKAIVHIWRKRSLLPSMAKTARIHYMSIIYRFFVMLVFTVLCCAITVSSFILSQFYERLWFWDIEDVHEHSDTVSPGTEEEFEENNSRPFSVKSAFQLGVYATWNVYVIAMLIFYAPSHKPSRSVPIDDDENEETTELNTIASGGVSRRTVTIDVNNQSGTQAEETAMLTPAPSDQAMGSIHQLASKSTVD